MVSRSKNKWHKHQKNKNKIGLKYTATSLSNSDKRSFLSFIIALSNIQILHDQLRVGSYFCGNSTTFCLPLNNFVCFVLKLHNFTHSTKKDDLTGNQISGYGGKTRKWRKTRSRKERKLFNKFASVPHTHSVTSLLMKQKKLTVCLTTTIFICLIFIPQPQNAMPIPETHHNHHHEHSTMSLTSAMVRQSFIIYRCKLHV